MTTAIIAGGCIAAGLVCAYVGTPPDDRECTDWLQGIALLLVVAGCYLLWKTFVSVIE